MKVAQDALDGPDVDGSQFAEHPVVHDVSPAMVLFGWQLSKNTAMVGIVPPKDFSTVRHAPGHLHDHVPVLFAKAVLLWSVG